MKKLAIVFGALIVAFLPGYIPSSISSRSALQQNADLEQRVRVADLGGQLAMASYGANRNNYAHAARFSGRFFSGLPGMINETKDYA